MGLIGDARINGRGHTANFKHAAHRPSAQNRGSRDQKRRGSRRRRQSRRNRGSAGAAQFDLRRERRGATAGPHRPQGTGHQREGIEHDARARHNPCRCRFADRCGRFCLEDIQSRTDGICRRIDCRARRLSRRRSNRRSGRSQKRGCGEAR